MKNRSARARLALCLFITIPSAMPGQNEGSSPGAAGPAQTESQTAQEAKQATSLSLEELANVEVYSASKHMQRTSEAPSSVTVVTRDEIQKYGYRTLADVLRSVRGFYVTYDRLYDYLGVRGFGRLGDWNSRVLVLIDGHRINSNVNDQALLGTEFPLDVDLIERIEIVRGPGSSLYGSNAVFAVINVITRKPSQMKGLELSFEPASFGTYGGRATFGGKVRGVEMLLSGSAENSAGQDLFFPEFDTPPDNNGLAVNMDNFDTVSALAVFSFRGLTAQVLYGTRQKRTPTAAFDNQFNNPRFQSRDEQEYFDLSYQRTLAEKWQLVVRTSWDQVRLVAPQATPLPDGSIAPDEYLSHGDWWTGEIHLSRTFLEKHTVTFGSEERDNTRQEQDFFAAPVNTTFRSSPTGSIAAVYGQDEFAITSKLTFDAGLRYDHYSGIRGSTNPRLGLIYHPWGHTSLKALYGTAFRAPDAFEIYPVAGAAFEYNPQLAAETERTLEAVAEQELGHHFTVSGSVFQNRIRNLITEEFDPNTNLLVYRNAQRANATGTEEEFRAHWAGGWEAITSFTFVDADDGGPADGKLDNSPRHMAKLNVIAPLLRQRLFAGLDAQYTGQRPTLAGNLLGGFPLFNVTLLSHAWSRHLDLSASLYNALDRKYADPAPPSAPEDSIQQDGRNFRVKITARF